MTRKIRIGIDVGGTFTDAVAIDSNTMQVIDQIKVPTTHDSPRGVAEGVIKAIKTILESDKFQSEDVTFIAHGTTQATNALLEGDVVNVGILGMASGLDGLRAKGQARVGDIELTYGHVLTTFYQYLDSGKKPSREAIESVLQQMGEAGAEAFVASEAYSVDDPENELEVMRVASRFGYPACGTHQISKRYGLKIRTRTAVINASILPKMVKTANMTEVSVQEAGISAPLMIMRGDGGAMTITEMRNRPILTLLSGPAAGVAGALMYARVSDGIFLEVGGTSTDISAIRNGEVQIDNANVGGHSTYLPSLDVRTVGLAGGSMIRLHDKSIAEVGPRSAHIAGLRYAVYANPEEIEQPELFIFSPRPDDPKEYVGIKTKNGQRFALTLSGAANIAGMVNKDAYAAGNVEAAQRAFQPLTDQLGVSTDALATMILDKAIEKLIPPIKKLMNKYDLDESNVILVGGGGGAASVVPYLGKKLGYPWKIAPKAEVISTIGVALAMVREMIERTISNPSKDDILKVRREAQDAVLKMGALPESIDITVEIDKQSNLVRAIARGALEMRSKDLTSGGASPTQRKENAATSLKVDPSEVKLSATTDYLDIYSHVQEHKILFGLITERKNLGRVVDRDGVIRLKIRNMVLTSCTPQTLETELAMLIDKTSTYKESGKLLPNIFIIHDSNLIDLSGLVSTEQIIAIGRESIAGVSQTTTLILVADKR